MTKSMILPILTLVALTVKAVSGYEVPNTAIDQAAQFIVAGAALYVTIKHGIIKNHKK